MSRDLLSKAKEVKVKSEVGKIVKIANAENCLATNGFISHEEHKLLFAQEPTFL